MPNPHTRPEAQTAEPREPSPLAVRLLRRRTESLGLIDVVAAARHHARLTRFLSERVWLHGQLGERYVVTDEAPSEGGQLLLQRRGGQAGPAEGYGDPFPIGPAPTAGADPTRLPRSFVAPQAAAPAVNDPPAPAPSQPPRQTVRVSRDSAARTMRRERKPAPSAPDSAPGANAGGLARGVEQTSAHGPAARETPLALRGSAPGRAAGADEHDPLPPGHSRVAADPVPARPTRGGVAATGGGASAHASGLNETPFKDDQRRTSADPGADAHAARASTSPPPPAFPLASRRAAAAHPLEPIDATSRLPLERGDGLSNRGRPVRAADTTDGTRAGLDAGMPLAPAAPARLSSQEAGGPPSVGGVDANGGRGMRGAAVRSTVEERGAAGEASPEIVWRKSRERGAADGPAPATDTEGATAAGTHAAAGSTAAWTAASPAANDAAPIAPELERAALGRLTDSVMRAMSRRLAIERERRGMRP